MKQLKWALAPAILLLAVAVLYGGFLFNPAVFDDGHLFQSDTLLRYARGDVSLAPRSLAYLSYGLSHSFFGRDMLALRLPGLFFHAGVAIALYVFLRELWLAVLPPQRPGQLPYTGIALLAALIFALHPVAVYGAGYLMQRTIVLATLFALLMWWSLLRGLRCQQSLWLWASAGFYALALLSKEHVVMAPAVSVALSLLWWRSSNSSPATFDRFARKVGPLFLAYIVLGALVVLQMKGVLGRAYEPWAEGTAAELLDPKIDASMLFSLSVFNQAGLFFKYLGLWVVPGPMWLSVDMREGFATSFWTWPQTLSFVGFWLYPFIAAALLWRSGRGGILGFGLLAPWLLFLTEISTVRIQEPFVLYRSYLWSAPAFASLVVVFGAMEARRATVGLGLIALAFFPLAYQRLQTFSHPLLLWDDAAALIEGKGDIGMIGASRIYLSRGKAFEAEGKVTLAIADYSRALEENSRFYQPYLLLNRGASYFALRLYTEALNDFNAVISMRDILDASIKDVLLGNAFMGRGVVLKALNRESEATLSFRQACEWGWQPGCVGG